MPPPVAVVPRVTRIRARVPGWNRIAGQEISSNANEMAVSVLVIFTGEFVPGISIVGGNAYCCVHVR